MLCNRNDGFVDMNTVTMQRFCTCCCYYTDNVFLEQYRLHVRFVSEAQFNTDYRRVSESGTGCDWGAGSSGSFTIRLRAHSTSSVYI